MTHIDALRPRGKNVDVDVGAVRLPDLLTALARRIVRDVDIEIIACDLIAPLGKLPEVMRPRKGKRLLNTRRKKCVGLLVINVTVNHRNLLRLFSYLTSPASAAQLI